MRSDFLPSADDQFYAWCQNFLARLQAGAAGAYGLTAAQITQFQTLYTAYATALQTSTASTTRTRPTIQAKDTAKAALAKYARVCVGLAQKTPGVTDAQRRELKITVAKKRTPTPMPTARPMTEVTGVVGRTVSMNVYDSTSATKRGKPVNCVGAKLYTFVGTSAPSDTTLWDYQGDYTKTKVELTFGDDVDGGAQIFISAAWYTRTNVGPTSAPVSTFLQGGSVQQAEKTLKIAA